MTKRMIYAATRGSRRKLLASSALSLLLATAVPAGAQTVASAADAGNALPPQTAQASQAAADPTSAPAPSQTLTQLAQNDGGQVETVVVDARKYQENAQDVPIPITNVAPQLIEEKDITNFQQLQVQLPTISYSTGNNKQTNIGIRGIGNNGSNQDGLDPSVGILVDGVYQARLGYITNEFVDLEQIELLRGPQGTLFGKNTTAGVILINTQQPSFTASQTFEIVEGNYGTQQYKMNLTGPITDDLAFRLTAYNDDEGGWVQNVQNGEGYLQRKSWGTRGQLLYQPLQNLSIRLIGSADYQNFHTGGTVFAGYYPVTGAGNVVSLAIANGYPFPTQLHSTQETVSQVQSTESSTEEFSLHADWDTDFGTFSDITAYTHWQFVPNNNQDQPFIAYTAYGTNNNINNGSEEVRFTSKRGEPVEWQAGLYGYVMDLNALNTQILGPQYVLGSGGTSTAAGITQAHATGLNTGYHYSIFDDSYAAYGAGTWHITSQWDFNGGLRYTLERKSWNYNGYVTANPGGATPTEIATVASGLIQPGFAAVNDDSLGYQAGTSYHFTDDIMAYVSYAKGEKSSGINQNPLSAAKIAAGASQILQPEKATNLEAGVKSEWLNHSLQLNLTAYDELVTNYQATGVYYVPGTSQTQSYLTNVGAIRTKGIELENTYVPIDDLILSGSIAIDDAYYASYPNASCAPSVGQTLCNFTGDQVPYTPKYYASETAEYSRPIGDDLTLYGVLDGNWRSKQNLTATLDPYSEIGGYAIGDLKIGVRFWDQKWDWSLWVDNFTNTYYYTALTGTKATGILLGTPGEPISYGTTLRISL